MALQIPGYRIIRKIAQGGMSTVFLAIQISVGRIVALKVMNPSLNSDPAFSERFQREATIVGQLSHPNIVAIYDIGRQDDLNYIAMDYLPGGSVHDKMINGLTGDEALRVTKEIASALDHAHEKGYVHRDIKPENILFRSDGSAVLSDFGVAKGGVGVSRMTHVGTVVGTPHYMSPEQTRGQAVDARSDLYSLGVVFFEMLTGTLPYQGDEAVTIALKHISAPIPRLPFQFQAYQKMLEKFLAKDPAHRFQTGHEVNVAIEQIDASNRAPFIASTAPEDLSVMALFRALILATFNAFYWRWRRLINTRWSKEKGFHQHKKTHDSVYGSEITPTLFGTRINHNTYINPLLFAHHKTKIKATVILCSLILIWCGFSLITQLKFQQSTQNWPRFLTVATRTTAGLFTSSLSTIDTAQKTKVITPIVLAVASSSSIGSSDASSIASSNGSESSSSVQSSVQVSSEISAASSSQSSSEIPTYPLTLKVTPDSVRIKLLGIPNKYKDGVELATGKYRVEFSKQGYLTKTETIDIKDKPLTLTFQLEEAPQDLAVTTPAAVFGGKEAPALIRIPAGNFIMGDDSNMHTAPAHKVVITKAFAISKYEVTFAEYDLYAQAMSKPLPGDNGWGRDNHPVIHVSWDDAQAYTKWLSKVTGKKFRLPTEAEWEYVARAGSSTPFWWGGSEADAKGKANCRRGCFSNYSGLFGSKTAPVGSYLANPFGIYDTAGNVSEWVQDCYQENYNNANPNGAAHEEKSCADRVVRGGSTKDNVQRLISTARDNIPQGFLSETLGFRIAMDF